MVFYIVGLILQHICKHTCSEDKAGKENQTQDFRQIQVERHVIQDPRPLSYLNVEK